MKYNMRPAFARYGLRLFDVTMRDGLQSVKTFIPLEKKKDMAIDIITKYNPSSIEIGSLVSEKAMPQMSTSIELFKFTTDYVYDSGYLSPKIFMLIPPKFERFAEAHELGVKHVSIMSSVSDDFQKKNVRMSIAKTRSVINNSLRLLPFKSAKVYLSCVDECPVSKKKLNVNMIIHNIKDYIVMDDVTEVCLSDTMGTLKWWRFVSIIEGMNDRNIPLDKLSLHLHLPSNTNYDNITRIIHAAIKSGIYNIDISAVSTGGCNMTLDNTQLHGNMTYDVLESVIEKSERMTERKYNKLMLEN
jgi:isopropylmalate/homocitrate/citramalate synthase